MSRVISARALALVCRQADLGARLWRYYGTPEYDDLRALWVLTLAFEIGATCGTVLDVEDGDGDSEHMRVREAAERSGYSERAIRRAIDEKRLPAHKTGRDWCIHSLDLADFLYRRSVRRVRAEKEQRGDAA